MNKLLGSKFTKVPNAFFKVISQLDLPCVAKDILWVLIRWTYGYHKEWRPCHMHEVAKKVGCPDVEARRWFLRLIRWGVIIRAKCSVKKSKRKYKPRYAYAVNPTIRQWIVFKRKRFYKEADNTAAIESDIYLLSDKYEDFFHQPPDETIYNEFKDLLSFYSPRRLLGIMKKSAKRGEGWEGVINRLSAAVLGGTE